MFIKKLPLYVLINPSDVDREKECEEKRKIKAIPGAGGAVASRSISLFLFSFRGKKGESGMKNYGTEAC
jgi:hypothetical protein